MALKDQFRNIESLNQLLNLTFKSGKHEGNTFSFVCKEDPSYIFFLYTHASYKDLDTFRDILKQNKDIDQWYEKGLLALIDFYAEKVKVYKDALKELQDHDNVSL